MDQVPAVMVHAASSSVATVTLGVHREVNINKQAVEENNLVEQAVIQHNKDPTIGCPALSALNNRVTTTNQDEHVRGEAIFSLLAAGLRQILHGQITLPFTGSLGSILVPSSLIQIDLISLGIDSLNISVNCNGQSTAITTVVSPVPTTSMVMIQIPEVKKASTILPAQHADLLTKKAPITQVYYRSKFKKTFTKQLITRKTTITKVYYRRKSKGRTREAVLQSVHDDNVFADFRVSYVPVHLQPTINEKRYSKCVSRRRKSNAPISTQMLRRSLRLKDKFDGHKPEIASSSKRPVTRNKLKGKNVAPQPDLLNNILLSPVRQENEFPGLSDITKYNDIGAIFPEIPIQEIQKVATEKCRIAPSEVTAELLLASRHNEASSSGSSTKDMHLLING
jgi:hypothetical protein